MNKREENIQNHINATLESLEGIQRATPGPFFFTRVAARLQPNYEGSVWETISRLIARPAIAIGGLCIVILINALTVVKQSEQANAVNDSSELALVDEYSIGSTSLYDYVNSDQR